MQIKFIYNDGSSLDSTLQTHTTNQYQSRTYTNPSKEVSSVEVWLSRVPQAMTRRHGREIQSYLAIACHKYCTHIVLRRWCKYLHC